MEYANSIASIWAMPSLLFMSLIVTIVVSVNSHKTSKRLTSLEMLRGVDQQWQTLNSTILSSPDIQRHIYDKGEQVSDREIVRKNIAYYVLNVELQVQRSRKLRIIDERIAKQFQEEHMQFLKNLKVEVLDICANSAVYRNELPELIEQMRNIN